MAVPPSRALLIAEVPFSGHAHARVVVRKLPLFHLSVMAAEGRLVQIGLLQSATVENFDLHPIMLRRLTLTGSTLRARSVQQKAEVATALREKIWPLLDKGLVKPLIHATFPLEQARQAHEMMESSSHLGKILLVTGK
jgi:NADPH:quinone reductase-like Zn-dependent oxidoreductase